MPHSLQNLIAVAAATLATFLALALVNAVMQLVMPALVFFNMLQLGIALTAGAFQAISGVTAVLAALLVSSFVISGITLIVARRAVRQREDGAAAVDWLRIGRRTGIGCGVGVSTPYLLFVAQSGWLPFVIGIAYWGATLFAAGHVAGMTLRAVLRRLDPGPERAT